MNQSLEEAFFAALDSPLLFLSLTLVGALVVVEIVRLLGGKS